MIHSQRQGIGKALIHTICNAVRELSSSRVILYTLGHAGNEATLQFYSSLGFEMTEREKDFFKPGFDRIAFVKEL
ncbi:GNAT family N-acetyltransferase [Paenibacillus allorhizosphaerae]|uniref:GNAT family N-acetyltransferase n=1 Tax=Paenibacillus allorhizosphaerae TaxID=2849866 RepID=UPI001C4038B1